MTAPVARAPNRTQWKCAPTPEPATVRALAAELQLEEPVCRLLCVRGIERAEDARLFLRPRLAQLRDPSALLGMDAAVARLVRAVRGRERILVHGDYDVDGMCSTTILLRAIRSVGGSAVPFIPDRLRDGYDFGPAGVAAARRDGATLIVTCDCGTTAVEPVRAAAAAGIDVIITDHHLPSPGSRLPEATALINPRQPGCGHPDKGLAAAGLAYKLALALTRAFGASPDPIHEMLDLVALATVADVAPLVGENRVLVRRGLRLMAATRNPGLRALLRSSGLDEKEITAGRVGFTLAPRLNAAGRLGSALDGVRLLMADDPEEANGIARALEELNRKRQETDRATLEQALEMANALDLDGMAGLVLARADWHPGVIGIVASRLVEELGRPVVLLALHNGVWKGSGRSVAGFDLHAALTRCRDLLQRFGGHRAAAGVMLTPANKDEFLSRFDEVARAELGAGARPRTIRVDMPLSFADATPAVEKLLRHFEPFGMGNPAPTFCAGGVRLASAPRVLKNQHLKLRLVQEGVALDAMAWGKGALASELAGATDLEVVYHLERNVWKDEERLQANLVDVHF